MQNITESNNWIAKIFIIQFTQNTKEPSSVLKYLWNEDLK